MTDQNDYDLHRGYLEPPPEEPPRRIGWSIAVALLVVAVYRRAAESSAGPRISPQFQQLSPAEQKTALESAERARRSRGGQ